MRWSLLASALLASLNSFAAQEEELSSEAAVEKIEVRGSYIDGYGAHNASGASRINLPIKEIAQSISVITSAQMNDYQLNGINSVLDTATGVNVERVETDRTYYSARGFDITNFQVDGIGLPLIRGNNHGDGDSAIYDRIEVVRGANGLMTGVGNPSATINFIRKRPTVDNVFSVKASLGSWQTKRLEADGSYRINSELGIRGVAVAQSGDSYLDRYEQDKHVAYLLAEYQLTEDTAISLSHVYSKKEADGNNWGANPLFYTDGSATDYDVSLNTAADWAYWDVEQNNSVLELSHHFANNWYLRGTYSYKQTDEDSELFYVYGTPDRVNELGLMGYASEYDHNEKTELFDLYIAGDFGLFGRQHEFVAGVNHADMHFEDISLYDYTTGNGFPVMPSLLNWKGNTPRPVFLDGLTGADVDRKQQAVYFTTRFSISDDFHVTAGGRQNDWQVTGDSYDVAQDANDNEFIPYFGAVYALNEGVSAYASYTETFLSQTELDIDDKALDPVTGESKEIGIKAQWFNDRLITTIAYFDLVQRNLAELDPTTANLAPDQQRYRGAKGIESSGVEVEVAGEVLPGLQTSFGYSDFSIEGNELVERYTPQRLVKFAATYTHPRFKRFSFGVNMRWQEAISRQQGIVAEGFVNAGDIIMTHQDAYSIIDLMARYQIQENLALTLNVNNITDEKYLTSLYWAQGYYGAPAHYSVTINWAL